MKWDNDKFRDEKYLIFDAIVAFMNMYPDKRASEISIKDLIDLIDGFFEEQSKVENEK